MSNVSELDTKYQLRDMEALVTIQEVGAYSERQYQKQDGTSEYFKRPQTCVPALFFL